ncbi:MAG: DUF5103 domain-containing protein [Sphingobacteriaceae bacterium]
MGRTGGADYGTGSLKETLRMKNILVTFFLLASNLSFGQQKAFNEDLVYLPEIKSVEFYNQKEEQSFPIITLGSVEKLELNFDDLGGGSRNFSYTIEHCDAEWKSSGLSPADYLQSFTEDRINEYRYAVNTLQKYTHYTLTIPNVNIIPKLSGNYLLKIYEDGDPLKSVLTRKFYILQPKVTITADIVPSAQISTRASNQKVNFQLDYAGIPIQNPYAEIRTLVMQNERPDRSSFNTRPQFIRGNQLIYNDVNTNDFSGGNEFRRFDLRSLRLNAERIEKIYQDTANTVILLGDVSWNQQRYTFQYDNNGNFFIRNQDGSNPKTDADYAHVYFSLAADKTAKDEAVYILGKFNNYQINAQSKMHFDETKGRFHTNLFLKQGIYDYHYVTANPSISKVNNDALDGSYFETENNYQLMVYYRRPGARWEELVGYRQLQTVKK